MKHFIIILTLVLICVSQASYGQAAREKFPNEYQVQLDTFFKTPNEAKIAIELYDKNFQLDSSPKKPKLKEKILFKPFMQMLEELRKNINCSGNQLCLTVIKVQFGLDKKNDMVVFYQPGYLSNSRYVNAKKDSIEGKFEPLDSNIFFTINNNKLDTVSVSDVGTASKRYQKNIRIKIIGANGNRKFVETEDTEYSVFSIQELYRLYHANNCFDRSTRRYRDTCNYSGMIRIVNAAVIKEDSAGNKVYRHEIMFSPPGARVKFIPPPNPDHYANLGSLCPPKCDLVYPLEN